MPTVTPQPSTLPWRTCGAHDLRLPLVGIGCWAFGGGTYWGNQDQADVDAVVHGAIDAGCGFFDTAEAYNGGASEEALGRALRDVPRDQVVLCTKISPHNTAPDDLVAHCDASLRRLGTNYVDLYMVHWPITARGIGHYTERPEVPSAVAAFQTLVRLQAAGKIRHLGVSNFGIQLLQEARAAGATIAINELPCSLITRGIEAEVLPWCRNQGIGVLGYMSLSQGVLSDSFQTIDEIPEWRRRTRHFAHQRSPLCRHGTAGTEAELMTALAGIRAVARDLGLATADLALAWACQVHGITSSLVGCRTLDQLELNLRAAQLALAPEVLRRLDAVTEPLTRALGPGFDYYEHPTNDRTR